MKFTYLIERNIRTFTLLLLAGLTFLCSEKIYAQQEVVLPTDGSFSQETTPQGALRFQRTFYLIKPIEMAAAGIPAGIDLNSIGFTYVAAQDTTTVGELQVYLENTLDTEARTDTAWTSVTVNGDSLAIDSLAAKGDYEWQVRANCGSTSPYTTLSEFSNLDLETCPTPLNLTASEITDTSARLSWYTPENSGFDHFIVEYTRLDTINKMTVQTSNNSISIYGLSSKKNYQWSVRTYCSIDSSELSASSFSTLNQNNCNAPSALQVNSTTDNTASLDWTAASGATRYDVRFRRLGTSFWYTSFAFTDEINLTFGLASGTTYEWQVRTVCVNGSGAFVAGQNFTTTGSSTCYAPTNLYTNNISDTSATLRWTSSVGATSYTVRYRLKNAIDWNNAISPMTLVHDDSVTIPSSIGNFDINFSGGSTFTYSGGGLYVAFQYQNDTAVLSSLNNALATTANTVIKNQYGGDSLYVTLSLNGKTDMNSSGHASILTSTNLRPETSFGADTLVDSVSVDAVYALGHYALGYSDTSEVSARITNHANEPREYKVEFRAIESENGTLRYSTSQIVNMGADTSVIVSFSEYVPLEAETDSLIISIMAPLGENVVNNNSNCHIQHVNSNYIAYDDKSAQVSAAGFGVDSGLILVRHSIGGCGRVNGAEIYLDESAAGHAVYAVILNENGAILDSSASFTPSQDDAGGYHTFYFPSTPSIQNTQFYVGLAQQASQQAYYPVGVQWESVFIRDGAYYRDSIAGGNLTETKLPGRLMIRAQVIPGEIVPIIFGDLSLCIGDTIRLTSGSLSQRYANEVCAYSSQFSSSSFSAIKVLGPPDVYPLYQADANAWSSASSDDQREYLELEFSNPGAINYVDIYETLNPGAVDSVYVKNPGTDQFELVYFNTASEQGDEARINRITFPLTLFDVSKIRIALASDEIAGFNCIDAVAIGEIDSSGTFASYLWSPGMESTSSLSVTSAGNYELTAIDNSGCGVSTSVEVVSPDQTVPLVSIANGDTTVFCIGDSVELISDQPTGNIWSTGATTQSIIVHQAGKYAVSYDDGTGCGLTTSDSVTVTVNTLPSPSISGTLAICPGGSRMLDAGGGYASYIWSNADTTQKTQVSTAEVFTVTVTDSNGCVASTSETTFFATPPSPSIAGSLQFCPDDTTTLDAGAGYSLYDWSTGAATQTIGVMSAGTYSVTVTDTIGCTGETSATTNLLTPPSPTISGNFNYCQGDSTQLDAGAGYISYSWSTGADTRMIYTSVAGSISVTVTDANGCNGADTGILIQHIPPTPVITGSFAFCGGSTTTLDAGEGYDTYLWSSGQTSSQINVSDTGTYYVTVTDNFGCSGVASATTTVEGEIPESPGPITGPTSGLCNATLYVWTVPDSVTIVSGQGTTTLQVNFDPGFTGGMLVVAASNPCGQSPSIDPTFLILNGAAVPDPINGPSTGMCNQSMNNYSITPIAGATDYHWTVPPGSVIQNGQGTASIDVLVGNTSGEVCVTVTNDCGISNPSCLSITVNDFTADAGDCDQVAANFSPFNCTDLEVAVSGGNGPYTYTWEVVGGSYAGNTQNINVCPTVNTTYAVTVTDSDGCEAISQVDVFAIYPPSCRRNKVQVCHVSGNQTLCLNTTQAQFHILHGDRFGSCNSTDPCANIGNMFNALEGDAHLHSHEDLDDFHHDDMDDLVRIYPNPASSEVVIERLHADAGDIEISVYDALQRLVLTSRLPEGSLYTRTINLDELISGMYIVKIKQAEETVSIPLMVNKDR